MSTLNSRLQLSILNRKKGKNLGEKGFTLIELLITVVILGTLSAVAVPGFLAQRDKANIASVNAHGRAFMASCATAVSTDNEVDLNLIDDKEFGGIIWKPTLELDGTTPTKCSSTTDGADVEQEYLLMISTGEIRNLDADKKAVDAKNLSESEPD
jgi:type IV pilus assembly protein PilA